MHGVQSACNVTEAGLDTVISIGGIKPIRATVYQGENIEHFCIYSIRIGEGMSLKTIEKRHSQ